MFHFQMPQINNGADTETLQALEGFSGKSIPVDGVDDFAAGVNADRY
jgi:hypothetical protein